MAQVWEDYKDDTTDGRQGGRQVCGLQRWHDRWQTGMRTIKVARQMADRVVDRYVDYKDDITDGRHMADRCVRTTKMT